MSLRPDQPAALPKFRLSGLALSTLAIVALTGLLFLLASLLAALLLGTGPLQALQAQMHDMAAVRANETALVLLQVFSMLVYLSHLAAVALVGRMRPTLPLAQRVSFFDWHGDRQFWVLLALMLAYVVMAGLALEQFLPESKDWLLLPKSPLGLFLSLILVVALAPIAEELLFRGWIYTGLRLRLAFVPTLLITSALFALPHFERTFVYALVVFPVGLALGFVRERYGSVKASMIFHAMFNLFGWIVNNLQA